MSGEIPGLSLPLEQLGEVSRPSYVVIEGRSALTGYTYSFGFVSEHLNKGPHIKIVSEQRKAFLVKGTEQQAQDAIVDIAQQMRRRSGGVLGLHPYYGAVWGTKLTPVSPGFYTDLPDMDENLSMFVHLTDVHEQYDESLTREALAIGTAVIIPGPYARRFLDYMKAPRANPNQYDRDRAIVNGLGARWDEEFRKYHPEGQSVPRAMELTPVNIVRLMKKIKAEVGITDLVVTRVSSQ